MHASCSLGELHALTLPYIDKPVHVLEGDGLLHLELSVPRSMLLLTPRLLTIPTGSNGAWRDVS